MQKRGIMMGLVIFLTAGAVFAQADPVCRVIFQGRQSDSELSVDFRSLSSNGKKVKLRMHNETGENIEILRIEVTGIDLGGYAVEETFSGYDIDIEEGIHIIRRHERKVKVDVKFSRRHALSSVSEIRVYAEFTR